MVESKSADGSSPLNELYAKPEFVRGWHNDVSFHVAQNAFHLRKYRNLTQSALAGKMETSQSAVARIEGGDENITLKTLKKLITNLGGRLLISFPPEELDRPHQRAWWEAPRLACTSTSDWAPVFVAVHRDGCRAVVGLKRGDLLSSANAF